MIELYQLQWSHYVEKVRWALDYKRIAWRSVEIVAFVKREMRRFECAQTVPLIHDTSTGAAISDSSPIIRYLDETYPEHALFPADACERAAVWRWMLTLDSTLGLHARRLAYTQVIMECPLVLPALFMPHVAGGLFVRRGWRVLAAPVLGAMLAKRFRFAHNRIDRIYEQLEAQLIPIAVHIEREDFLVGARFSAADLTLACLLRPLRIVPHFRAHAQLRSLFAWQGKLFREHRREPAYAYETMIEAQRRRSGWMRSRVGWMQPATSADIADLGALQVARNDIHPVGKWTVLGGIPDYLKLRWFNGVARTRYTAVLG
jgi:glutathione S-transferase